MDFSALGKLYHKNELQPFELLTVIYINYSQVNNVPISDNLTSFKLVISEKVTN